MNEKYVEKCIAAISEFYYKYSSEIVSIYRYGSSIYPFLKNNFRDCDFLMILNSHFQSEDFEQDLEQLRENNKYLCICVGYEDDGILNCDQFRFHFDFIYQILNAADPFLGKKLIFENPTKTMVERIEHIFVDYTMLRFNQIEDVRLHSKRYYYLAAELLAIIHGDLNFTEEKKDWIQKAHDCHWTLEDRNKFRDLLLKTMQEYSIEI